MYIDIKIFLARMVLVYRMYVCVSPVGACVLLTLCLRCCLAASHHALPSLSCSSSNCISNHCQKSASSFSHHPTSLLTPTCLPARSMILRYHDGNCYDNRYGFLSRFNPESNDARNTTFVINELLSHAQ